MDKSLIKVLDKLHREYGYWKQLSGKYRQPVSLWHHSLLVADISYNMAKLLNLDDRIRLTTFLAGFLHDYIKSTSGEVHGDILGSVRRVFGDVIGEGLVDIAYNLATHVEAGPQTPDMKALIRSGIDPQTYSLMAEILTISDAIASLDNLYEFERALIHRDKLYWIGENRWRRYLDILEDLDKRNIYFNTIRLTDYTHPILRALILDKLVEKVTAGKTYFKIYYPEGIAIISNSKIEPIGINSELIRDLASKILSTVRSIPLQYEKPGRGTPVTIDLLLGLEDVDDVVEGLRRFFEEREILGEMQRKNISSIAKGFYGTTKVLIPREKRLKPDGVDDLDKLRDYLSAMVKEKMRVDEEYLSEYIERITFTYYLGGTLVKHSSRRSLKGSEHCYLCGEVIIDKHYYPLYAVLANRANLQVKYWIPSEEPLRDLDSYRGEKYRLCPACYIEVQFNARLGGKPPYIIIKHYPVMTDLIAEETMASINIYARELISASFETLTKRLKTLVDKPLLRRIIALQLLFRGGMLFEIIEELYKRLQQIEEINTYNLAITINNIVNDLIMKIIPLEEAFEEASNVPELYTYEYLARYNLETIIPISSPEIDLLDIGRGGYDISKTVAIALSPILSFISILTGGQVLLSDHIGVQRIEHAVETPHAVFQNAVFYDVSGKKARRGLPLPVHLLYTAPLIHALTILLRIERVDVSNEFIRLYSLYRSGPYVFHGGMRLINRILFHMENPSRYRRDLERLINLIRMVSLMGLDIESQKLVQILDELVEWMNKYHYVQSRAKHGYIAPLNRAFESLFSKLSLIDKLGRDSLIELAAAEFAERIRRDVEARGYHARVETLAEGVSKVKKLLKLLLDIYVEKKDTHLLRDLVNDIYNYVFIKRLISKTQSGGV